jgi:hypothetical protein
MRIEIIRPDGDLKREIWAFTLSVDYSRPCIYFDHYSFQTRESTRKRIWHKETYWDRLNTRESNIPYAVIPHEVDAEMRIRYRDYIATLPIRR